MPATTLVYSDKSPLGDLFFPTSALVPDPASLTTKVPAGFQKTLANSLTAYKAQLGLKPDVKEMTAKTPSGSVPSRDSVELPAVESEYVRPNGEFYIPRSVTTGVDKLMDVAMVKKAYETKIPVLLYGPPGTGKTALVEAALPGLITISGSGDTEVADFQGAYVQNADGTFTWVDGPLVRAMENGVPLFIDEVALIDPRVMSTVYSVMDGRNELVVTANPARGTVTAKDGFYVAGACNPDVPGAVMSEALMSRFLLQIEVLTDFDLAVKLGVAREIVVVAKNLKRKKDAGEIMRSPQMRELLAFGKIDRTFGRNAACANFIASAEPGDRGTFIEAISSAFGKKVIALTIQ